MAAAAARNARQVGAAVHLLEPGRAQQFANRRRLVVAMFQQQPAARLVPADQQMASGRYRTDIQVANGAQPVPSSSENYTTTAEVSVIR